MQQLAMPYLRERTPLHSTQDFTDENKKKTLKNKNFKIKCNGKGEKEEVQQRTGKNE